MTSQLSRRARIWIYSIRDAFVSLIPLTLFGVLAVLARNFPLPAFQQFLLGGSGQAFSGILDLIIGGTHGVFGLSLAVVVAIHLRQRLPVGQPLDDGPSIMAVGLSSLINFMLATLAIFQHHGGLGYDLMLVGIGVGLFSAEFMRWAARRSWLTLISATRDADLAVHNALRLSVPTAVSGLIVLAVASFLAALPTPQALFDGVAAGARESAQGHYLAITFVTLVNQLFWFVGIHGGHILDTFGLDLFVAVPNLPGGYLVNRSLFDAFVLMGGSGATLGLLVAIYLQSRSGSLLKVARVATLPAMFNINEMVLFGLPVVLSPLYLLPFVLTPVLLALLAVAAVSSGWLQLLPVSIPWTTPPFLSGWLLTGSIKGVLLQALGLLLSIGIYWPFVRRAEARRLAREDRLFRRAAEVVLGNRPSKTSTIRRLDEVGSISRRVLGLLREDVRHGRLLLHYQPKHDCRDRLLGFEALVRWPQAPHPSVSPAMAVILAEEGRLINELGLWVFRQALAFKARLNQSGFAGLSLAINVSPLQLAHGDFAERIARLMAETPVQPAEIEIEITESQVMPDDPVIDSNIQALGRMGFKLAMDDFGMGHTSLLHLRRFAIDVIKIDGSLTRDVLHSATNGDIIRAIAALGQARDIAIVAEFVETAAQKQALANLGCHVFQGYYYSPPLAEADCLAYCRRQPDEAEVGAA